MPRDESLKYDEGNAKFTSIRRKNTDEQSFVFNNLRIQLPERWPSDVIRPEEVPLQASMCHGREKGVIKPCTLATTSPTCVNGLPFVFERCNEQFEEQSYAKTTAQPYNCSGLERQFPGKHDLFGYERRLTGAQRLSRLEMQEKPFEDDVETYNLSHADHVPHVATNLSLHKYELTTKQQCFDAEAKLGFPGHGNGEKEPHIMTIVELRVIYRQRKCHLFAPNVGKNLCENGILGDIFVLILVSNHMLVVHVGSDSSKNIPLYFTIAYIQVRNHLCVTIVEQDSLINILTLVIAVHSVDQSLLYVTHVARDLPLIINY